MKVKEYKDIKVVINEPDFKDEPEYVTGMAFPDENWVIIKYPKATTILHELIHILEYDKKTCEAIKLLWYEYHRKNIDEMIRDPEYIVFVEDILKKYPPEHWKSEIYAYVLSEIIYTECDEDFKTSIDSLIVFVCEETGILVRLAFETTHYNILKID